MKHGLFNPPAGLEDVLAWVYLPHPQSRDTSNKPEASSRFSASWTSNGLLETVLKRSYSLVAKSEEISKTVDDEERQSILLDGVGESMDPTSTFLSPLSKGAIVMLKRTMAELEEELWKLAIDEAADGSKAGSDVEMHG